MFRTEIPMMFAALLLLSVAGIVIFFALSLVSHLLLRRWHEAFFRMSPLAACVQGADWRLLAVNPAYCELLGYDDERIHDAIQVVSYFNYINRVAEAVQRADAGIAAPGEDELFGAAHADHLVID